MSEISQHMLAQWDQERALLRDWFHQLGEEALVNMFNRMNGARPRTVRSKAAMLTDVELCVALNLALYALKTLAWESIE